MGNWAYVTISLSFICQLEEKERSDYSSVEGEEKKRLFASRRRKNETNYSCREYQ